MFATIAAMFLAAAPARRSLPFISYPIHDLDPVLPMSDRPAIRKTAEIVRIPLCASEAAKRFVEFMQVEGKTGPRLWSGRNGLWEWYLSHCFLEDLAPLPEQVITNGLEAITEKGVTRDRSTGKLRRLASYDIPEVGKSAPKAKPSAPRKSPAKGKKRSRHGTPPAKQKRAA